MSCKQLPQKMTGQNDQLLENKMRIGEPSAEAAGQLAKGMNERRMLLRLKLTVPTIVWSESAEADHRVSRSSHHALAEKRTGAISNRDSLSHRRSEGRPLTA